MLKYAGDNRSARRREQHRLFQELGTLYRTRANLCNILNTNPPDNINNKLTLEQAILVIDILIYKTQDAMATISSRIPPESKQTIGGP